MTLLLFSALLLVIVATYNRVFSDLGQAVCTFMYGTFGYGCYLVIAAFVTFGLWLVFGIKPKIRLRTTAALALTLAVVFMLFQAVTTRNFAMNSFGGYIAQCYSAAEAGYSGYTFGGALSGLAVYPIARGTTFVGAYIIFSVLSAACLYLTAMSVRGDIILARGGEKKIKPAREPRSAPAPVLQQQAQTPEMPDNVYTVDNGQQIVNNFHPVPPAGDMYVPQPQPAVQEQYIPQPQYDPQPEQRPQTYASVFDRVFRNHGSSQDEDDRFSNDKLGRKIIFEKGEFAAESYRRNMIFDEDSYFNHPVRTGGDGSGSSSSGASSAASASGVSSGIVSSASAVPMQSASQPASQPAPQQPSPQPEYPQSYTDSYSEEVEGREQGPSTPSYIYGDKPAESLDDIPSEDYDASDSYYGDIADVRGGDYSDVYDDAEPYYTDDDMSSPVQDVPAENASFEDFSRSTRRDGFTVGFSDNSADRPADDLSDIPVLPSQSRDRGDMAVPERRTPSQPSAEGDVQDGGRAAFDVLRQDDVLRSPSLDDDVLMRGTDRRGASEDEPNDISGELSRDDASDLPDIARSRRTDESCRSSELPSLREEIGRETLFDGDDDDYLTDDIPDLGDRSLRSDGASGGASRRNDLPEVPDMKNSAAERPARAPQSTVVHPVQSAEPAPEKPKHVWKKYVRPSLDLLADYPENNNANVAEIEENKKLIIETLDNFHIGAHISDVIVGPAITRYDVIIEDRINIKNAMRYREAIAMALMKENVTTYLNYKKGAISIEVPNGDRAVVGLKSILKSNEFINCKPNSLTFALGKNVEGKPNCPDITKMPHLLVAGTTGSGKSICLSSLIISLLYKYGPDELRFILVDPKQSEFISYENLPHLIVNEIISDVDKAIKALNWAIKEMERRYTLFKEMTQSGTLVKNLNEYNSHLPADEEKLPKIVIILDEFGDLMLQNKKDVETRIIRLVQKSRAAGIHLILATQRPSVDCITGLIKSNLPTRIGFKVNSFDDSRTIFDTGGAEKLLGAGDMYLRLATNPDLTRIQGCFIDSPEVQAVTDFVKKNNESYFDQSVSDFINTVEEPEGGDTASDDGEGDVKIDDKFIQALKFCVTSNQASVSMLQRRFPIGYVKACKIIDWMENMNYITQSEGSKPRKVLLSMEEFTRTYGEVDD